MSHNKKTILLENKQFLVVDLTEPLMESTEVFPGDKKIEKIVLSEISKNGCQHHIYKIGDHVFHPHGDAPKHQNSDLQNRGFEFFGLDYCFNQACLIDLSNSFEAKEFHGIKFLVKVEEKHLKPFAKLISKKRAVLVRTGYDKFIESNKKHVRGKIPFISKDATEFLAGFKNLKVFGIDSLTIDACAEKPVHFSHQALKDKLIIESIVHLYEIPLDARENFLLQTTPVRIVGATGGPVVAYAFIKIN